MYPPESKTKIAKPTSTSNSRLASRSTKPKSPCPRSGSNTRFGSTTASPPNKDKPLPPSPPRIYPSVDPRTEPRASPVPPTAPFRGPSLEKASRILGTSALLTNRLSQASQQPTTRKASKVLGSSGGEHIGNDAYASEQVDRERQLHGRKSSDNALKQGYFAAVEGIEPADVSHSANCRSSSPSIRGHRRNWGSNSTQASRTRSDSSSSVASLSTKNTSLRTLPSQQDSLHRQHASLSRIVGSPSSVYSERANPASLDLDNELAETQAFWAAHPLTVTSSNGEPIVLEIEESEPQSSGLRRRSRSLSDLKLIVKLPSLYEPLPLEAVPEWATMAPLPQPLSTPDSRLPVKKEPTQKDVIASSKDDNPANARTSQSPNRSTIRPEVKMAAKVMKRLTMTRQIGTVHTEPLRHQVERSRASVNWARAYSTVKSLGKERMSVDEIIPMRGPNAVPAAQQAEMRGRSRYGKFGSKEKVTHVEAQVFQAAVLQPIAPVPQIPVSEAGTVKRETPDDMFTSGAKSDAQIMAQLPPMSSFPPVELEGSELQEARGLDPNYLYEVEAQEWKARHQEPVSSLTVAAVRKEERDSAYYKTRIAAANSLFDKFIQNPDEHQVQLQQLIDDTRHKRKTTIKVAQPLEVLYPNQGLKASEVSIPNKMPPAPALQPAPHKGVSDPISGVASTTTKKIIPLRLDTRVTPPRHAIDKRSSRRNSRKSSTSRVRKALRRRSTMQASRTPVHAKVERLGYNSFPFKAEALMKKATSLSKPPKSIAVCKSQTARQSDDPMSTVVESSASFPAGRPLETRVLSNALPTDPQLTLLTLAPTVYVPPPKTKNSVDEPMTISPPANITATATFSPVSPELLQQGSLLLVEKLAAIQSTALQTSYSKIATPDATERFEGATLIDHSCPESPILPQLEVSADLSDDDDDDTTSVKSFSHIAPGIETPNYHALDWWESSPSSGDIETPELEGSSPSVRVSHGRGRTVAEIKSWQFDLDDELAKLREWDWSERGESPRMLFTLDFDAVPGPTR